MPLYKYQAKNEAGKIISGEAKVESQEALKKILLERGYAPLDILEKNALTDISQFSLLKPKIKIKDMAVFCRQFAVVLEAGIPIASALDVLCEQMQNITFKECLTDVYEHIQKGVSLSMCMKQHTKVFPDILINMVESGEISGSLDKVFVRMADHFEKEFQLNHRIKSAMMFPIIVSVVATLVIAILMIYVVPTFAGVLTDMGSELPIFTKVLIAISNFFKNFWWMLILTVVGIITGTKQFSKSITGKRFIGNLSLKVPILKGVQKIIITARFTRTLGTLISSGVLLIQSLEIVTKVIGNASVEDKLQNVIEEIKRGKGLTQPLAEMKYFPPMLISMVRIGEESGNIDFALDKSADFYDQEVDTALKQFTALLEPIIMVIMGVVVGFVILSILYPMISVYQSMSSG